MLTVKTACVIKTILQIEELALMGKNI